MMSWKGIRNRFGSITHSEKPHLVSVFKSGKASCDCLNYKSKSLCAHTITPIIINYPIFFNDNYTVHVHIIIMTPISVIKTLSLF